MVPEMGPILVRYSWVVKTHWISTGWPPSSLTVHLMCCRIQGPFHLWFLVAAVGSETPVTKGDVTSLLCLFLKQKMCRFFWGESYISEKRLFKFTKHQKKKNKTERYVNIDTLICCVNSQIIFHTLNSLGI